MPRGTPRSNFWCDVQNNKSYILATGTQQVVLATDFGQIHSDLVPNGTVRFAQALSAILGDKVSRKDLLAMFSKPCQKALRYFHSTFQFRVVDASNAQEMREKAASKKTQRGRSA